MNQPDLIDWLAERLDRIENKVDSTNQHCSTIDVTLGKQAVEIEHHIRRTDALEARVEQVANDLRPINNHIVVVKGLGWIIGGLSTLAGAWTFLKDLAG
jgi:archaellum component FlaC